MKFATRLSLGAVAVVALAAAGCGSGEAQTDPTQTPLVTPSVAEPAVTEPDDGELAASPEPARSADPAAAEDCALIEKKVTERTAAFEENPPETAEEMAVVFGELGIVLEELGAEVSHSELEPALTRLSGYFGQMGGLLVGLDTADPLATPDEETITEFARISAEGEGAMTTLSELCGFDIL